MKSGRREYPAYHAKDRKDWRAWLRKNHERSDGVWLIFWKKASGKPRVSYADSVEEALCFGWIDSVLNPIDAHRYKQLFTPRKIGSEWSALNKRRIEKLRAAKLLASAGLARIEQAQRDGSWSKIDHVEALTVPEDLARLLARDKRALANFQAFSPSNRKGFLHRINSAKSAQTRTRRLREIFGYIKKKLSLADIYRAGTRTRV